VSLAVMINSHEVTYDTCHLVFVDADVANVDQYVLSHEHCVFVTGTCSTHEKVYVWL
jgi:hypothetical protein